MKINNYALVFLLALAIIGSSCSTTNRKQIDAETFIKYGKQTTIVGSASQYNLEKIEGDHVVIRHWSVVNYTGSPEITFYTIPLSELPKELADDLKAGKNPWVK